VVADSHAEQLIAFEVTSDGALSERRVRTELEHAPDGICADADGAVWVASVPGKHCVRVREGGEVLNTVSADRGCFACMLGGEDGRTLFIAAAEWRGMEAAMSEGPGLIGRLLAVPDHPRHTPAAPSSGAASTCHKEVNVADLLTALGWCAPQTASYALRNRSRCGAPALPRFSTPAAPGTTGALTRFRSATSGPLVSVAGCRRGPGTA
jgi:hypothetical protein